MFKDTKRNFLRGMVKQKYALNHLLKEFFFVRQFRQSRAGADFAPRPRGSPTARHAGETRVTRFNFFLNNTNFRFIS